MTPTGPTPAYRAQPAANPAGKKFPTVLVVQEISGVHEHINHVCRRFAKLGYLAGAPELFFRQGDVSKLTDFKDIISKVVSKVPDAQVLQDRDATPAWASQSGGDPSKLAITGFCWGGRIVWLYAPHNSELKPGVAWSGRLTNPKSELQPHAFFADYRPNYREEQARDGWTKLLARVRGCVRRGPPNCPTTNAVKPGEAVGFRRDILARLSNRP